MGPFDAVRVKLKPGFAFWKRSVVAPLSLTWIASMNAYVAISRGVSMKRWVVKVEVKG